MDWKTQSNLYDVLTQVLTQFPDPDLFDHNHYLSNVSNRKRRGVWSPPSASEALRCYVTRMIQINFG